MKQVYTSPTPVMAGFIRQVLENAGIRCILKNYFLGSGAGDLPVNETWPEIWVGTEDETRALAVIRETLDAQTNTPAWECPQCHEWIEGQFQGCWKCGYTGQP